jgi:hypothetical protein
MAVTADATEFPSIRNTEEPALPFVGEIVVATARCTRVATSTEFNPELNNLPFTKTRRFLKKYF